MMNLVAYFRKTNPPWNLVRAELTFASSSVKTMADKRVMAGKGSAISLFTKRSLENRWNVAAALATDPLMGNLFLFSDPSSH